MQRLVLIFLAFFTAIESYATEQVPNNFIHKGINYYYGVPERILEPYLDKDMEKWKWLTIPGSTALWRGYIATLEVVNNELVLKDIKKERWTEYRRTEYASVLKEFLSTSEIKDSIFKIDWFSGTMILGGDKRLYHEMHEHHLFLEFKNGVLIKESSMNSMEYLETYAEKYNRIPESEIQRMFEIAEHNVETKKGANSELANKLKIKYKEKFGEPISDFELSVTEVGFRLREGWERTEQYVIRATRTAKGARAMYRLQYDYATDDQPEIELSMEEWLDFVRILHKCHTDKWEETYGKWEKGRNRWDLDISYSNKKTDIFSGYEDPPNWVEFKKTIDNLEKKIRRGAAPDTLEEELKSEYKKRFGIFPTELELSTRHVRYMTSETGRGLNISVTKTATGAIAEYDLRGTNVEKPEKLSAELDIGEWLDFINALHKSRIDKWAKKNYNPLSCPNRSSWNWHAEIFFTDRVGFVFRGGCEYPRNWNAFKKAMNNIETKIREKAEP